MVRIENFYESDVEELILLSNSLLGEKDYDKAKHLVDPMKRIAEALLEDGNPILYEILDGIRRPLEEFLSLKAKMRELRRNVDKHQFERLLSEIERFLEEHEFDEELGKMVRIK